MQTLLIGLTLCGSLASAAVIQKALLEACLFAINPNRKAK
jgi:hypothetical protein